MLAALCITGYNLWDDARAGRAASEVLSALQDKTEDAVSTAAQPLEEDGAYMVPDYVLNPKMDMPTVEIDGNQYIGTLTVPSRGLSLPVISEWSYAKLKTAPCRYSGSAYTNDLVIAGHSYKRHFRPLRNLPEGDTVLFTDAAGNVFTYEVGTVETLRLTMVEEMTDSDWDLSLFTCTPNSRARIVVRCMRTE
ncbi:MAG: sortase [Eubacteriales bacterium]|nr:sortase [Eubacteriales bacterium]